MAKFKIKLISATTNPKTNAVTLEVKITDATNFSWNKKYYYNTTKAITLADFKNRVTEDIKTDLKIKAQMQILDGYIGQEISITI